MFKPGDKVVCVLEPESKNFLKYGKIYTIKYIEDDDNFSYSLLKFEEIPNKAFSGNRFISLKEYRKQKLQKLCSK